MCAHGPVNYVPGPGRSGGPNLQSPVLLKPQLGHGKKEQSTMAGEEEVEVKQQPCPPPLLSKNAQKKLIKQQRYEAKKAEKKALLKEQKKKEAERKRIEWEDKLAAATEEEKQQLIESKLSLRKERMDQRTEEKGKKMQRLTEAKQNGQNVVIDLEFGHLMNASELHSLVQQVLFFFFHFL